LDRIEKLVRGWADNSLTSLNIQIGHLEKRLYRTYEPNKFRDGDFWERLAHWLNNVSSDEEKQTLFRLIPELLYVGPTEIEELYRSAYEGPIKRWLIDLENIDICAPDANDQLANIASTTWFCPVTDSLRINAFYHINNLSAGADLRPDWCSLHQLGDINRINSYCQVHGITRLVLLEDFVGGGSQSLGAVEFAANNLRGVKVLFAPLMICPTGAENARVLAENLCKTRPDALRYDPVLELQKEAFLTPGNDPFTQQDGFARKLHAVIDTTYPKVSGGLPQGPKKPYHPYGYPSSCPTGGLLVMYSNTPDNTLPLIHWRPSTKSWYPIFPRHSRV